MQHTRVILLAEFYFFVIICLITVFLFETDIFFQAKAVWVEHRQLEFLLVSMMEIMTICFIPLCLKMVKFKKVKRFLTVDAGRSASRLLLVGTFRMMMLCLPMLVNTLLYYLFMQTTFGYMAIILLLCLCFVYPSSSRCESETTA